MKDEGPFYFGHNVDEVFFQEMGLSKQTNQSHSVVTLHKEVLGIDVLNQIAVHRIRCLLLPKAEQVSCHCTHALDIANLIVPGGQRVEDIGNIVAGGYFLLILLEDKEELFDGIIEDAVVGSSPDHILVDDLKFLLEVLGTGVEQFEEVVVLVIFAFAVVAVVR